MNDLLSELSKKLADRWLSSVLLPGLLFTGVVGTAAILGHSHALDLNHLIATLDRCSQRLRPYPAAAFVVVSSTLLIASAAGILAQGLAGAVNRMWTARRPRVWIKFRRKRVSTANPTAIDRYLPARATHTGDRFYLLDQRIDAQYGLSIVLVWPRLWLLLSDPARNTILAAYTRYQHAAVLGAWALLYLALGALWWPAAIIGVLTAAVSHRRSRNGAAVLAELIEATVDTHQQTLASAVGVPLRHGRMTPAEGIQINDLCNKGAQPTALNLTRPERRRRI